MAKGGKAAKRHEEILVRRHDEEEHDEHHGGAWKVAYADFVTAMMAFFLLLWILNAVDEEKLQGIADYFAPTVTQNGSLGGEGVLAGQTMGPKGTLNSSNSPFLTAAVPNVGRDRPGEQEDVASPTDDPALREASEAAKAMDEQRFVEVETQIIQAMKSVPEIAPLLPNVIFDKTPEGLRIQIVDHDAQSMFPSGSAKPYDRTRELLRLVGSAVAKLPNKVIITGHTDAHPYASDRPGGVGGYGNWELSADRANATRRVLIDTGVPDEQVVRVSGVAARDPLKPNAPYDAANRRISIVLTYHRGAASPADADRMTEGPH